MTFETRVLVDHLENRYRPRDFVGDGDEEAIAAPEELDALGADAGRRDGNHGWRTRIAHVDERYGVRALEADGDERAAR